LVVKKDTIRQKVVLSATSIEVYEASARAFVEARNVLHSLEVRRQVQERSAAGLRLRMDASLVGFWSWRKERR
jgi:hypothetical protein